MAKQALTKTIDKYVGYLTDLKQAKTFHLGQYRINYNIAASLNSWLIVNKVVSCVGEGEYKWVSRKPITDLVNEYIESYRQYTRKYWTKRKAKQAAKQRYQERKNSKAAKINEKLPKINYDYVTTQNMLEEVKRMKMNPSKYLNEELCIQFLKDSAKYEYQIVRITKETL